MGALSLNNIRFAAAESVNEALPQRLLLIIRWEGRERVCVWNTRKPFHLKNPAELELAREGDKVLVSTESGAAAELVAADLRTGEELKFETNHDGRVRSWSIAISLPQELRPAFEEAGEAEVKASVAGSRVLGTQIFAFSCSGSVIVSSDPIESSFAARVSGQRVFRLSRDGKTYALRVLVDGAIVRFGGKQKSCRVGDAMSFQSSQLKDLSVAFGAMHWCFARAIVPAVVDGGEVLDDDTIWFNNALRKSLCGFLALTALALVWPSTPKKPKIEAQITRITFERPKLIVKVQPTPAPIVEAKPEPKKPEPTPEPVIAKVEPTPAPEKPKPVEKKIAKAKPEPKPQAKPVAKPVIAKVEPKPVAKPAPKVAQAPAPVIPAEKPAPKQPTAEEIARAQAVRAEAARAQAAQQAEQARLEEARRAEAVRQAAAAEQKRKVELARAKIGAALAFVSTAPTQAMGAPKQYADPRANAATLSPALTNAGSLAAAAQSKSVLVAMATEGGKGASAIATLSARSNQDTAVDANAGFVGQSKSLNKVLGKVQLPGAGAGGEFAAFSNASLKLEGEGKLNQALLEKALSKYMEKFQYCYEKQLLSEPSLTGSLVMAWKISLQGHASDVSVVRSQLNSGALHNCLSNVIGSIAFPTPQGGSVTVKFPFNFSSTSL